MQCQNICTHNKKFKLGLTKYVVLVLFLSILCFVGSYVGFKIIDNMTFKNHEDIFIINFIGFFNFFSFFLISLWIFIGSFITLFNLFRTIKTKLKFWIIFFLILLLVILVLGTFSILSYSYLTKDFVKKLWSVDFKGEWFNEMKNYFKNIIVGSENKKYLWMFIFTISWGVVGVIYSIANRILDNRFFKTNMNNNKKEETKINNENNVQSTTDIDSNENNKQDELVDNNKEESNVEQQKEEITKQKNNDEDDWLTPPEETSNKESNNQQVKLTNESNTKKDENDPYSIFD